MGSICDTLIFNLACVVLNYVSLELTLCPVEVNEMLHVIALIIRSDQCCQSCCHDHAAYLPAFPDQKITSI